jgi:hypothetical protein
MWIIKHVELKILNRKSLDLDWKGVERTAESQNQNIGLFLYLPIRDGFEPRPSVRVWNHGAIHF